MAQSRSTFRNRYPGPWTVKLSHPTAFSVVSANDYRLIYVNFRDAPAEWRMGPIWTFSRQEAQALANAIATLGTPTDDHRCYDPRQLELPEIY